MRRLEGRPSSQRFTQTRWSKYLVPALLSLLLLILFATMLLVVLSLFGLTPGA